MGRAKLDSDCNIVPYFRDLHLAYTFNLEPQLQLLAFQLKVPILAEGERKTIQSMLEETPELSQQFLPINIEEPPLTTARRILELWSEEQHKLRVGFKQRRLLLEVDESVLDWITVHGYHPDYGARFLRRMIERHVTTAISDAIVRDNPVPEDTKDGVIHDPRTGVTSNRIREVWKGGLDEFLEAWRRKMS